MNKDEMFKRYFSASCENFYSVILYKNDINYYKESEELTDRVYRQFKLISRIQWMTFKLLIIHLYGVVKESEDHSFFMLMKKYKKYFGIKGKEEEYKVIQMKLSQLQKDPVFIVIKNLRNKFYAHLSRDRYDKKVHLDFNEVDSYINKVSEIFKEIFEFISNGSSVSLKSLETDIDMFIYKALDDYLKISDLYLDAHKNNLETIKLSEIRKVLY